MYMDISDFPIVWLHYRPNQDKPGDNVLTTFEALLDRATPFVMIGLDAFSDENEHEHSPDERKNMALWVKKNRTRLRQAVLASILVEPSTAKRDAATTFVAMAGKFWGYPTLLAASTAMALGMAERLLAGDFSVIPDGGADQAGFDPSDKTTS